MLIREKKIKLPVGGADQGELEACLEAERYQGID